MSDSLCLLLVIGAVSMTSEQEVNRNISDDDPTAQGLVLDIYALKDAKDLPVVLWIHGGGWEVGDKSAVQIKPQAFTERGFVFVSTNYRLLNTVEIQTIFRDVAKSLGWVHKNIASHGGDPN